MEDTITLNPFLIQNLGIIRNRCLIKTDDYKLSCVPYTLSLKSCKVLLILSPREQKIITEGNDSILMLHLEFNLPDYKKPVPLFIRLQLQDFRQLNSSRNQCLLTADFQNTPDIYNRILIDYFQRKTLYSQIYNSNEYKSRIFSMKETVSIGLDKKAHIRRDEGDKLPVRLIDISLNRATFFIDTEETVLKALPELILLEFYSSEYPFSISATLADYTASSEVEGFYIIRLNLSFSICLTHLLHSLFPDIDTAESCDSGEPPEPEENKLRGNTPENLISETNIESES